MSKFFRDIGRFAARFVGAAILSALAVVIGGCGSGAVSNSSLPDTGPATLVLTLTDVSSTTARTSIAFGSPAKVNATFKTSKGNPIVGAVITFTTDPTLGSLDPTTGTALTDANGVASVTLSSSTASGAGTVTASGQTTISGATSPTTYTASVSYTAGAVAGPPTFTVTLTDPTTNAARTSIAPQNPAKVNAIFKSSAGAPIVGAVVTFATTATVGTFIPANGTAVTDSTGVASVLLYPSSTSGGASVTASSQTVLSGGTTATSVTGSVAYTATAAPAIVVSLTDPTTGAPRTSVSAGNPARVSATLRQTSGAPSVGTVVTFTTDPTLGVFSPASGTALTDTNGVAAILLNAASLTATGATIATASAQIGSGVGGSPVTSTVGYSVGAGNVTLGPVVIQTPTLSAFGTTGLSVTVSVAGVPTTTPLAVNFTSPCAAAGRAALTAAATTVNGVATATYRDIGCASIDTITATVSGLSISSTGTLSVIAPSVGSIQFVSSKPTSIALRGTGGAGRQETSLVSFRVVDVAGNPVGGKTVNFSLSTAIGGITITPTSATSDASTGIVTTNVQAGSISTPVRVTASTVNGTQTLSTQSDQLTISTGVATQDGFSLSVSTFNIEGWELDGTTTTITARLTDRYRNPVPDGVVVNFTAAGGSIVSSCTTVNGACSSTLTSQNFRPASGRVNVLAYAIGEESFTDTNGNGWYDLGEPWIDMPDAYVDVNDNGRWDPGEPFFKFDNSQSTYSTGDGRFNGVSCNESIAGGSAPGSCSPIKGIHVRGNQTIVFSGSTPTSTGLNASGFNVLSIDFTPICNPSVVSNTPFLVGQSKSAVFTARDVNGNTLPAGTTISFATTNGTIPATAASTYTVPSTNLRVTNGAADGYGNFAITVQSDVTQTATLNPVTGNTTYTCANAVSVGSLIATIKTPNGKTTTFSIPVTD